MHTTVTGIQWAAGQAHAVTGYPIHQRPANTLTAFVDVLSLGGQLVHDVVIPLVDLTDVPAVPLMSATDDALWAWADRASPDQQARILAELAYRDTWRRDAKARDRARRVTNSRLDAAKLLAA